MAGLHFFKKHPVQLLLVATISACSFPLFAASETPETLVVTGTKTERLLADSPVRIEVVTEQDIATSHARDLAEALKNVPGIVLKPIHGKSGQEVWMQGLDADRVLILVDSKPVSASTGSSVDVTQISVADVTHIEIVKGATSALYGSEAMGGVINVITKRAKLGTTYKVTLDSGSYGEQNVSDGPFNDNHANFFVSHNSGSWFGQLMTDVRYKQGTDLDDTTWDFEGAAGTKTNVAAKLGYQFSNGAEVMIAPSYYYEDINKNFRSFSPGVGEVKKEKREEVKRKNISISFDSPVFEDSELSAWYMFESFTDNTEQDTLSTDYIDQSRLGESTFNKGEVQLDHALGEYQILTVGIVALKSTLAQTKDESTPINVVPIDELQGEKQRTSIELYAQDDIFIGDQLEILPGIRYQNDSDFGSYLAPKINLMYDPNWLDKQVKFRIGAGSGYRAPTLKERHYIFDHSALGYMVLGNEDLVPETSTSLQFGADYSPGGSFHADVNFYYNDIKNLISTELNQQQSDATNLSIYEYSNIGEARTKGVDITSAYDFTEFLSSNISYTYLDAINLELNKQLTQRPKHQAKINVSYKVLPLKSLFSLYGSYQSEQFVDDENLISSPAYSTFDFKVNTDVTNNFTLFMGVDNFLGVTRDVPLTGHDFRPENGRFIYLGVRFSG
ncbi:TonB-dependent receptor plug domain-containing protein [Psychromonas sp. Urea-02u-13]|uniref:TonB-dependent receptor plug domain-containing protein n=1 Tax=Psychromonas sp. Urea-02u-13 TaxID=2058326 RepID=UPI000C31DE49|nr:TonB-dependent receptor [Psychromonas sp. Urea-02u-13]PKG39248.1 TonB-dependent receptor [Psychromonas sp. Urea-02u-13]